MCYKLQAGNDSKSLIEILVSEQVEGKPVPTSPNLLSGKTSLTPFPTMSNASHNSSKSNSHVFTQPLDEKATPTEVKESVSGSGVLKSSIFNTPSHFNSQLPDLGNSETSGSKAPSSFMSQFSNTSSSNASNSKPPICFTYQPSNVGGPKTSGSDAPSLFMSRISYTGSSKNSDSKPTSHFISQPSDPGSPNTSSSKSSNDLATQLAEVQITPTRKISGTKSPKLPSHFVSQPTEMRTTLTGKVSGSKSPAKLEVLTTPTSVSVGTRHKGIQKKKTKMDYSPLPDFLKDTNKKTKKEEKEDTIGKTKFAEPFFQKIIPPATATKTDSPLPDFLKDTDKSVKKRERREVIEKTIFAEPFCQKIIPTATKTDSHLPDFLKDADKKVKKGEKKEVFENTKSTEHFFQKMSPPTTAKKRTKSRSISVSHPFPQSSTTDETLSTLLTAPSSSPKHSPSSKPSKKHHKRRDKVRKESLLCEDVELTLDQEEGERGSGRRMSTSRAARERFASSYRPPQGVNITVDQAQVRL